MNQLQHWLLSPSKANGVESRSNLSNLSVDSKSNVSKKNKTILPSAANAK